MSNRLLIVLALFSLLGAAYFGLIRGRSMRPVTGAELAQQAVDATQSLERLNAEEPQRRDDPDYQSQLQLARTELLHVKMEQMNRKLAPALFVVSLLCWGLWLWIRANARKDEASPTAGIRGPSAETILAELNRRQAERRQEIAQLQSGGGPPAVQGE